MIQVRTDVAALGDTGNYGAVNIEIKISSALVSLTENATESSKIFNYTTLNNSSKKCQFPHFPK